eukprot:Nk52_evm5s1073 gene=Nk52_evmTU5s1073
MGVVTAERRPLPTFILFFGALVCVLGACVEADWRVVNSRGERFVPTPRHGHSGVRLNGHFYMFGGLEKKDNDFRPRHVNDFWSLNLNDLSWSKYLDCPVLPRQGHSLVEVGNRVCVFGGEDGGLKTGSKTYLPGSFFNDIQCFSTSTTKWEKVKVGFEEPAPRQGHTAVGYGNKMIVFGGLLTRKGHRPIPTDEVWVFTFSTGLSGKWQKLSSKKGPSPSGRHHHSATLFGADMYVFGGGSKHEDHFHAFNDMWKLNLVSYTWENIVPTGSQIPSERSGHSTALWNDHLLMMGGGLCKGTCVLNNELWAFSLKDHSWVNIRTSGPAPSPRHKLSLVVQNDQLVVFGGETTLPHKYFNDVWIFDMKSVKKLLRKESIRENAFIRQIQYVMRLFLTATPSQFTLACFFLVLAVYIVFKLRDSPTDKKTKFVMRSNISLRKSFEYGAP